MKNIVHENMMVALVVAGAWGCASTPAPTARVASSAAAIRAARELRADDIPSAQLYLKLAQDEHDAARRLIDSGDNEKARGLLWRSEADAELAVALAKEVQSQKSVAASQAEVKSIDAK